MYIDGELFGTGKDVTNISVAGFRSVSSFMEGESAPSQVNDNEGIVGDAIDSVINVANTVNWNAVRANGSSAAGIAVTNSGLLSDILDERIAINRVLREYDEAKMHIMDGDL